MGDQRPLVQITVGAGLVHDVYGWEPRAHRAERPHGYRSLASVAEGRSIWVYSAYAALKRKTPARTFKGHQPIPRNPSTVTAIPNPPSRYQGRFLMSRSTFGW